MRQRGTRLGRPGAVLTACLAYVLALQLIASALAGSARLARSLDSLSGFGAHALCMTEAGRTGDPGDEPGPLGAHSHDLCCTLAVANTALLAPAGFITITFGATAAPVVHSTTDLTTRPATAPPGQGPGPRAPPSHLA
jgi:hypothetical protein